MQAAWDWQAEHATCSLDVAWNRRILLQRHVQQVTKMLLVEDNDMIQAISADRTMSLSPC
jgi:hypothetical protein